MAYAWRTAQWLPLGLRQFTRGGYERAQRDFKSFEPDESFKGKQVIITGANRGIGLATAKRLASFGAHIHLVCRDPESGKQAVESIRDENHEATLHLASLDSLAQVRAFTRDYLESGRPLHILIHNAGCMIAPRRLSKDGLELNFQVNLLAPLLMTEDLLPLLRKSEDSRVVFVSSGGLLTQPLVVDDMQWEKSGKFDATQQYARNKRAQVALVERWAKIEPSVKFLAMHPGWVDTLAVKNSMPDFHARMQGRLRDVDQGADTVVYLAAAPSKLVTSGEFYLDRRVVSKHLCLAGTRYSETRVEKLYEQCQDLLQNEGNTE